MDEIFFNNVGVITIKFLILYGKSLFLILFYMLLFLCYMIVFKFLLNVYYSLHF